MHLLQYTPLDRRQPDGTSTTAPAASGTSQPASGNTTIASPATIKIVVSIVVATAVVFCLIIGVLFCYRDNGKRSRCYFCFRRNKEEQSLPHLPSKDGYGHDDRQPLTGTANSGTREMRAVGGPRFEGRSWTDQIRHSMWMDRPRRSYISPARTRTAPITDTTPLPVNAKFLPTGPGRPPQIQPQPQPRPAQRQPVRQQLAANGLPRDPSAFRPPVRPGYPNQPPPPLRQVQPRPSQPRAAHPRPAQPRPAQPRHFQPGPTFNARGQGPRPGPGPPMGRGNFPNRARTFDDILAPPRAPRGQPPPPRRGPPPGRSMPMRPTGTGYPEEQRRF